MFEWLLGKKAEPDQPKALPPTQNQLNYARKLHIAVPPGTSRDELSAMLSNAETANPNLRAEREQAKERKRETKFGPELIAQEKEWERLSDENKWLLVAYKSGKQIKAEVLRINGAFITDAGKLKVEAEAGKVVKDRYLGYVVDLGRYVELDPAKVLWWQITDDFDIEDAERFSHCLQQAEAMARQFAAQ